jgi:predicted acetyltransferase
MTLELVSPTAAYRNAFLATISDYQTVDGRTYRGNEFELAQRDFDLFLQRLENEARGIDLMAWQVPQSTFWTVKDSSEIVGTIRIRHRLTQQLAHHGGHIGYDIRPSARHQGYGTRQLALALPRAADLGLKRVLLTCNVDNIASARIIEANGGVLESQGISNVSNTMISRYWIEL